MGQLDGNVAIVTGSAGAGIGQATARLFAREGASVVVTDVHPARTQRVAGMLSEELGRELLAVPADVSDRASVEALVQTTLDRYGRIDVLVNNAYRDIECTVAEMTDEIWHAVVDVCLLGTFYCTRAVLPAMMQQRSGSIINLASIVAWNAESAPRRAHYAAAKAGIQGFTRALAMEVGAHNIRANVARLGAERLDQAHAAGDGGAHGRAAPAGTGRGAGGDRERDPVPGERAGALYHRRGVVDRRAEGLRHSP